MKKLNQNHNQTIFSRLFYKSMVKFEWYCFKKFQKITNPNDTTNWDVIKKSHMSYNGIFISGGQNFKGIGHNYNILRIGKQFRRYLPVLKEYKPIFGFYLWYWFN